jgi:hypothetical protein
MSERLYALLWRAGARFRAPSAVHRAVFTGIYERNEWGSDESRSGPGSTLARGAGIVGSLEETFVRLSISSLLDAPCGDFNWMRYATGSLQSYTGVDVVREIIARNVAQYADAKHRFLCRDMTSDPLPSADAILCRDALVHFSHRDICAAIRNFKRSEARYLITTTFENTLHNEDIRTGGWRTLNLRIEPFHFPEPLVAIQDIPAGAGHPDKRLCVWRLDEVPGC